MHRALKVIAIHTAIAVTVWPMLFAAFFVSLAYLTGGEIAVPPNDGRLP